MTEAGSSFDVERAVAAVRGGAPRTREQLEELVRIPSISADPTHAADVERSADASAALLEAAGLERVRRLTVDGSPPYVVGEWLHAPGAPTVLLYAHHDVQPPGIVEHWTSDPFEPREAGGRLYGRGSADDKAGAVAHAAAVSAWLATAGALPCNVRVMIEGEEEISSPHLAAFLAAHAGELASDALVLADSGNWAVGVPGLTYSLRGLAGAEVRVRALDGPQHSGMVGGVAPDPVLGLSVLLASLVDEHGEVAVDGIFDDVRRPTSGERARLDALPSGEAAFRHDYGVRPGAALVGDPATSTWERLWMRPAITVVGLDAHPIAGSSNQVLAEAAARVSVRLAPGQDPDRVLDALRAHLARRVPWGLELRVEPEPGVPAWVCEPEGPAFEAALAALRAAFGTEPVLMGMGGTIPFVGTFAEAFGGVPALLMGPDDPESRIHGEDESLHLADWASLMDALVRLLANLASSAGASAPESGRPASGA